ncbi:LytTR family DNA-binding domain-containing protein [Alteromonas gracilis]|uniref:LytTR family DNA-binding domain-containing protein n=1 Tax=Alteromonas gracilis TaxID=1479524 RepID=UPI0032194564
MMSSSSFKTNGSVSIWTFLLSIAMAYSVGLFISHLVTKSEPVFWSGKYLQIKNKEGEWVNRHRIEIGSESALQQVRFTVNIDDSDVWKQPISLILGGPFSAQILWDEKEIGSKGTVGETRENEKAGSIDYSVQVPQHLLSPGQHVIQLTLSTAHITAHDNSVLHYVWLAPYRKSGQRDIRYYLVPLLISSGLLILSFQSLRIGRSAGNIEHTGLGIYGLLIVMALLAETSRAGINYAYTFHELRSYINWFGVIGGALALSYTCYRVAYTTFSKVVLLFSLLAVLLIHILPFQSEDTQLALAFLSLLFALSMVFATRLVKKQYTYLSTLPIFCIASTLSANLSVGAFLDSFLFVGSLILIGGAWLWTYVAIEKEPRLKTSENDIRFLHIVSDGKEQWIAAYDCYVLKAEGNYTAVQLQNGESRLHQRGIGATLETAPPEFVRVHKSYAVNVNVVLTLKSSTGSKYWAVMKNGQRIPVSRYRVAELRGRLSIT